MTVTLRFPTVLLLLPFLLVGCTPSPRSSVQTEDVRTEVLATGRIAVTLTATPPDVALDRPFFLTFALSVPNAIDARLPPLDDRFEGFRLDGAYEASVHTENGRTRREYKVRLTPLPAPEYRLKPMAIPYRESPDGAEEWIQTKPVIFSAAPLPQVSGMRPPAPPLPVRLSPRETALWVAALVAAAGISFGLYRLIRRTVRIVRLRQKTPRERALQELNELLLLHLVEQGLIKEFYFGLTLVVRRYIERRHGIRAPEQTTEEFLASASANPRFTPAILDKLQTFLKAADLIKYAAYQPAPHAIPHAVDAAREYIGSDSPATGKETG